MGAREGLMCAADSHLLFQRVQTASFDTTGAAHPPTPSEQTHPQHSRYTPRCPSVVLWTPCSGVEWGVFEPTFRV
jgi:hypothetical protein